MDTVTFLSARDQMDRAYALPLDVPAIDVPAMARAALMSPANLSRRFRSVYGETPYTALMTRRIERRSVSTATPSVSNRPSPSLRCIQPAVAAGRRRTRGESTDEQGNQQASQQG